MKVACTVAKPVIMRDRRSTRRDGMPDLRNRHVVAVDVRHELNQGSPSKITGYIASCGDQAAPVEAYGDSIEEAVDNLAGRFV